VEAPKVVINQFAAPQIKLTAGAARPQLLHTGDFSGSSGCTHRECRRPKVQTGGFGDPNGLKGTGKQGAKLYAAQAGSFDLPAGPGQGNGSGGAKGHQRHSRQLPTSAAASPPEAGATAVAVESQPADSAPSRWFMADRSSPRPIPGQPLSR